MSFLVAQSGGEVNGTAVAFLVAMVVAVGFLMLRARRNLGRPQSDWSPMYNPRPAKPQKPAHHLGASEDFVQWEVQMHDLARELSGKLDSKMSVLAQLIQEADRAAARLEAAIERLPSSAPSPPGARDDSASSEPPPRPRNQAEALHAANVMEPSTSPPAPSETASPVSPDRRYDEIYLLADYGFDVAEIARRVGIPIGEIQLILTLRTQR